MADPAARDETALDPEILAALQDGRPNLDSALLDDTPLGGRDPLEDTAYLAPPPSEDLLDPLESALDNAEAMLNEDMLRGLPGNLPGGEEETSLPDSLAALNDLPDNDELALDLQSVDELMAEIDRARAPRAVVDDPNLPPDETLLSQDMLNAIIEAASTEEEVGSENLAAAATTPVLDADELTQNDLDHILEAARERGLEIKGLQHSGAEKPERVGKGRSLRLAAFRRPRLTEGARKSFPRVAAALMIGAATGLGTYYFLTGHDTVNPLAEIVPDTVDLAEVMKQAQTQIGLGNFGRAVDLLEPAIAENPEAPEVLDAQYLLGEARVKGFVLTPGAPEYLQLHDDLAALVRKDEQHPRAPEALAWKAQLYELDELFVPALDTYDLILKHYPNAKNRDEILHAAAELSLQMNRAAPAAQYAQELIRTYPGSPRAGEARLQLGRAYQMAGLIADARALYVRTVEEEKHSPLANQALLRLAQLAVEREEYAQAAQVLEEMLETTTTTKGNDEAYLMLSQVYQSLNRLEDARNAAEDLLNFFPDSPHLPQGYVELSQIIGKLGDRPEALRLAEQAAARFPGNAAVLKNKGLLLGMTGNPFGAAVALMAAEEAGAHEPALVLAAARHYRTAGSEELAHAAFEQLERYYAGTPEAYAGGIEDANLHFEQGQVTKAMDALEALALNTLSTPQHVPVLLALADRYNDLGLSQRVVELSRKLAGETQDPEQLARTVLALVRAGETEEALALLDRIRLEDLDADLQYRVQMSVGEAMLAVDPARALLHMEKAYNDFPASRVPADTEALLQAYLLTERTAAARNLVMDLQQLARQQPVQTPLLVDAAMTWGGHLYEKGDFRGALEAYQVAVDAANTTVPPTSGLNHDPQWAQFQRANSLLALDDFETSVKLFDQIAKSNAVWAQDAKEKAQFARLEQRRRGFDVTPPPAEGKTS